MGVTAQHEGIPQSGSLSIGLGTVTQENRKFLRLNRRPRMSQIVGLKVMRIIHPANPETLPSAFDGDGFIQKNAQTCFL